MICPFCNSTDGKVLDSRASESGRVIRRRRQCLKCGRRFTTYERAELTNRLIVVKRDGSRVPFNPDKVLTGIVAACGKRPIPEEVKRRIVDEVEEELTREFDREVASRVVGERVMARLRRIDPVAYIRFASEHLRLETIQELQAELDDLAARPPASPDHPALFEPSA